ncbi:lysophospholipid acyltransferase family protein [Pseudoalteromonas sp. BDTF-M6]|uniref:lysophospholipid acyltransferase family protein n=1 Tax=Pseudoalteromonas sp. BDTF-M6 TaxID=2796132 RepID=UPI001BAFEC0F|nr:lysophospholipid acyltransferase family protein [Pseudoalteromonas sp. BDTF-M6]MBS3797118.1 lysophospholipid acyltransferase family protein [Pseudoalteromonas sp. BDTF-M6]
MPELNIPANIPRTHSRFGRWLGTKVLNWFGWQVVGEFPEQGKFVAAVAPHTSNWDFVIAIAVKMHLQVRIRFLGKHSIFVWPLAPLLRKWGGIPVDRRSSHGVVAQVKTLFDNSDALILGLAPEGTRKYTPQWKSGFLHIAKAAKVPVVPMALDYSKKQFVIMAPLEVGEDIDATLAQVQALFPAEMAKYPEQLSGTAHKN